MDQTKIQQSVKIFSDRVRKRFGRSRVLLFGSWAKGKATKYSDVDIVVVSGSLRTISKARRLDEFYTLSSDLEPDFHVFGLTPEEYENITPLSTLAEAKTSAVVRVS